MIYPDTLAGWASFIAVGLLWLTEPSGSVTSPWLLLAAAGVIAAHLALLVAAQGPANMRPDGDQLRLWTRRGLRLWAFAVVLWTAERLLHSVPAPTAALIAGLVGLLATAGWIGVHARDEGLPYDWRKP
ncbi:MAG TPA: hypothetical protein VI452_12945 [Marmoricola sp.]